MLSMLWQMTPKIIKNLVLLIVSAGIEFARLWTSDDRSGRLPRQHRTGTVPPILLGGRSR